MTSREWCEPFCPVQLSTISVFYKQRNNYFFPVTSYALPTVLLRVPLSVVTGIIFTALTYFVVGFAPDVGRCRFLPTLSQHSSSQPLSSDLRQMSAVARLSVSVGSKL